jgi:hypothetical protein
MKIVVRDQLIRNYYHNKAVDKTIIPNAALVFIIFFATNKPKKLKSFLAIFPNFRINSSDECLSKKLLNSPGKKLYALNQILNCE